MPTPMPLSLTHIASLVPGATSASFLAKGGQKSVYRITVGNTEFAFKVIFLDEDPSIDPDATDAFARAKREVDTMRSCMSPYMVKLGPIGLTIGDVDGKQVLFFTEELIDGQSLQQLLAVSGPLTAAEVVRLGLDISHAINGLWALKKVHRDIKPGNIMRRSSDGTFCLLDAGLAFDISAESLSAGYLVGTLRYFSPEQFDYAKRRSSLDFRSDLFSLGVTMYECLTGVHPFWSPGVTSNALFGRIIGAKPEPPSSHDPHVPQQLEKLILRMMGKTPALRYRTCEKLIEALQGVST
ncbi:MAG: serine/threonine protein kinase [Planctomycetaceae bacterium]|nr:serine/threonine protein kinase [Planctomycetaceae bacterium]